MAGLDSPLVLTVVEAINYSRIPLSFKDLGFSAVVSQIKGTPKSRPHSCLLLSLLSVSCLPNAILYPYEIIT